MITVESSMTSEKMYAGQAYKDFTVETNVAQGAATGRVIRFMRPDETTGQWPATADGTKLVYDVKKADLNQVGRWRLQGFSVIGGEDSYGDIVEVDVLEPIAIIDLPPEEDDGVFNEVFTDVFA